MHGVGMVMRASGVAPRTGSNTTISYIYIIYDAHGTVYAVKTHMPCHNETLLLLNAEEIKRRQ